MADIELVIKIPEELYQMCRSCLGDADCIESAIASGTPLPKGHGRLIDADDCKKNKGDFCEESTRNNWYDIIDDLLDDAPTIIEADNGD